MEKKRKTGGLGRGLSALMADVNAPEAQKTEDGGQRRSDMSVPIESVFPNPNQPRRSFTPDQLEELAASVKEKGIIQPLIVRARPGHPQQFEIVAGERRWRAAQMAQLHHVPVVLRDFDDVEVLEIAIIENIQRADLNPMEEAAGYKALMDRFGHTQDKLSEALGKSRSYIANLVRLLQLPDEVHTYLREGKLSAGHARALITSGDPSALARRVIQQGLSVRETERLTKQPKSHQKSGGAQPRARKAVEKDADTRALEGDLTANLGMKVEINHTPGAEAGSITISYTDLEQLDELCMRLTANR